MSDIKAKLQAYKTATEDMLRKHGVAICNGEKAEPKQRFFVVSGNEQSSDPGYGLIHADVPIRELLTAIEQTIQSFISNPDVVRILHAQVQVYADLLTGCVYDIRVGLTALPVEPFES